MIVTGIAIEWVKSTEYIGLDLDALDPLPEVHETHLWSPATAEVLKYITTSRAKRLPDGRVELVLMYERGRNPHLPDYDVGTSKIWIEPGATSGPVRWTGAETSEGDGERTWNRISENLFKEKRREHVSRIARDQAEFKAKLLSFEPACVLTNERCLYVLEAAHIIPSRAGGAEVPGNGVILRADIHRLYDAGVFAFAPDGRVEINDATHPIVSPEYLRLLKNARLPETTLARVAKALSYMRERANTA